MSVKKAPTKGRGGKKKPAQKAKTSAGNKPVAKRTSSKDCHFPIIGIGASAGGLEALDSLFRKMPANTGMAYVVVVHLDPANVSVLSELLQTCTKMPVEQVTDGSRILPDRVYVIPPNKNLGILDGVLQLMDLPKKRTLNLPIDSFLGDLAKDQGANAGCIILSGTGSDGTLGLRAVKAELGLVMVQSEASAKYDGMPANAIATGLADYILSPQEMPAQLIKYYQHANGVKASAASPQKKQSSNAISKILIVLRSKTGHDFSQYKRNTIHRRIEKRMNVNQITRMDDYARHIQDSEIESEILFNELLIGVTSFFRDPEAYVVLAEKIIPGLFANKPENYTIRIWVPGCSSGEEAYSIAILMHEYMEQTHQHLNVQIFATDIDESAISSARTGIYPESISVDVDKKRLSRYFTPDNGGYRINNAIREMLVFATQNITKDPPFTKLNLICCRNLLIYFNTKLQNRLLPMFHYSLLDTGHLFLGTSETVGAMSVLFEPVSTKWRIFACRPQEPGVRQQVDFPTNVSTPKASLVYPDRPDQRIEGLSSLQLMDVILQHSDAPPSVIIDDQQNVIFVHGSTGRFLEPAEGKVNLNVIEMARQGLRPALRSAIKQAATQNQAVDVTNTAFQSDGNKTAIDLSIRPLRDIGLVRGLMAISFVEHGHSGKHAEKLAKAGRDKSLTRKSAEELEHELQYTRETLQSTIEELETSNEELKSTNEELQSTNEELQSTNEELETSKEELQSLNEESATVNAELQGRIDELARTHDDMKNLLDCTGIATLFLDTDMQVRRFTPKARNIIPLESSDAGRPIRHFSPQLKNVDLDAAGKQVLESLETREWKVKSHNEDSYLMRVQPYRTISNFIDGVVITFENISSQVRDHQLTTSQRNTAQGYLDAVDSVIVVLDQQGEIVLLNRLGCKLTGIDSAEATGMNFVSSLVHSRDQAIVSKALTEIRSGETALRGWFEFSIRCVKNKYQRMSWNMVPTLDEAETKAGTLILGVTGGNSNQEGS